MSEYKPRVFSQTFGVVGAVLERDGKILLVREAQRKGPDNGKWSHPAGWIDVGENPVDGVIREVGEESGYHFVPQGIVGVYSLVRGDIKSEAGTPHAIKIIFFGKISDEAQSLADDVTETKWFSPEEINKMDKKTLRDLDIKTIVRDYFSGKRYPLELLTHTLAQ